MLPHNGAQDIYLKSYLEAYLKGYLNYYRRLHKVGGLKNCRARNGPFQIFSFSILYCGQKSDLFKTAFWVFCFERRQECLPDVDTLDGLMLRR